MNFLEFGKSIVIGLSDPLCGPQSAGLLEVQCLHNKWQVKLSSLTIPSNVDFSHLNYNNRLVQFKNFKKKFKIIKRLLSQFTDKKEKLSPPACVVMAGMAFKSTWKVKTVLLVFCKTLSSILFLFFFN